MAEFLEQEKRPELSGFNAMGHAIPFDRRQRAYEHAKEMGLNKARAFEVVDAVAEQLKRDQPYEAMKEGMRYLDLTGTYRLMAVLLTPAK